MIINIFKMTHENAPYGDVLEDDHMPGDTFDRFYIFASGRIDIRERRESPAGDIATETETYEVLHTLLEKPTVEHTLSRFYGNRDIVFNWMIEEMIKWQVFEVSTGETYREFDTEDEAEEYCFDIDDDGGVYDVREIKRTP